MTNRPGNKRADTASRVIKASPSTIYRALVDPKAVAAWRPPEGMKCEIYAFDPSEGGSFQMAFLYAGSEHAVPGKTSEHADMINGRFVELVLDKRVVELVEFESDDPAFAGAMTITTTLTAVPAGTEVTFLCENVPPGILPSEHQEGMTSTLNNLAAFTE